MPNVAKDVPQHKELVVINVLLLVKPVAKITVVLVMPKVLVEMFVKEKETNPVEMVSLDFD